MHKRSGLIQVTKAHGRVPFVTKVSECSATCYPQALTTCLADDLLAAGAAVATADLEPCLPRAAAGAAVDLRRTARLREVATAAGGDGVGGAIGTAGAAGAVVAGARRTAAAGGNRCAAAAGAAAHRGAGVKAQ
jgi:hypothetical protein